MVAILDPLLLRIYVVRNTPFPHQRDEKPEETTDFTPLCCNWSVARSADLYSQEPSTASSGTKMYAVPISLGNFSSIIPCRQTSI